jgi:hypothetical protein
MTDDKLQMTDGQKSRRVTDGFLNLSSVISLFVIADEAKASPGSLTQ